MNAHSAVWRKSTRSGASGGNCVEAAAAARAVAVRDSKNPDGPSLAVTAQAWRAFTRSLRR